jgi:hypothetical protein
MVQETILQHWIFTKFALPFLLIFFIIFAILEKTKLFGEDRKQINALIAFIIGLIFVGSASYVDITSNLILFLTIAIVLMFIGLLLWGFAAGEEPKISGTALKWIAGVVIVLFVIWALLWSAGLWDNFTNLFFSESWSSSFWVNFFFIIVIAAA